MPTRRHARLALAGAAVALAIAVKLGCTDRLDPEQVCTDAGYAVSNRFFECTGDAEAANARFDWYQERFTCAAQPFLEGDETSTVADDDPRSPFVTYKCVERIRSFPCETLACDALLDAAITTSCSGVVTRNAGPLPDGGAGSGGEGGAGGEGQGGSGGGGQAGSGGGPAPCQNDLLRVMPGVPTGLTDQGWVGLADVTGDGNADAVVIDPFGDPASIALLWGNGDGTFQAPRVILTYSCLGGQGALGDINNDGLVDFVCGSQSATIFLASNGTLVETTVVETGSALSPSLGDFDGDGNLDLLTSQNLTVRFGHGDGTFDAPVKTSMTSHEQTAVADLDGDGHPDLLGLVHPAGQYSLDAVLSAGRMFGIPTTNPLFPTPGSAGFFHTADLNGDLRADVIAMDLTGSFAQIYLGAGDGTFSMFGPSPANGVMGLFDLDRDGTTDIVLGNGNTIEVLLHAVDPASPQFQAPLTMTATGESPASFASFDLDGDGRADLVAANGPTLGVWLGCRGLPLLLTTNLGDVGAPASGSEDARRHIS